MDKQGNSPLYYAVIYNHQTIADLLISSSQDANSKNNKGIPLIHLAIRRGHFDMLRLFLERGADPDAKDDEGNTLLHSMIELDPYDYPKNGTLLSFYLTLVLIQNK